MRILPLFLMLTCTAAVAAQQQVNIVPQPKQIEYSADAPITLTDGSTAIVLGEIAAEPEVYAAETLQKRANKLTGQKWPVVRENEELSEYKVLIVLGQRSTNSKLDNICSELKINPNGRLPMDGFIIQTTKAGNQDIIIVCGSNPRAVIFGQDTLSQLISSEDGQAKLIRADIRDWPSIQWRGKPQTNIELHLTPGMTDMYAFSRFNYTDLRNGIYAYSYKDKLPVEKIKKAIELNHRAGILVYGSVDCAVAKSEQDGVMKMFREFIELGVDGLWLSFDDHGSGEDPNGICAKALELGKQHGITKSLIAITPPKGSYQRVEGSFNKVVVKVAGMEDAMWFFTCVPTLKEAEAAKEIGLKSKIGWWHNWPRDSFKSLTTRDSEPLGILNSSFGRKDGKPIYMPVPRIKEGWHEPSDELLKEAAQAAGSIMEWGGGPWKQEYTYPILGWWGWTPETYSFNDTRNRIYETVYGPRLAEAAGQFDDAYRTLANRYLAYSKIDKSEGSPFPVRLIGEEYRKDAEELVSKMESAFNQIQTIKPEETSLDPARVNDFFVDSARAELETAKAVLKAPYVEYWWDAHQMAVLDAIYDNNPNKANDLITGVSGRVISDSKAVSSSLAEVKSAGEYAKWWKKTASLDANGWKNILEGRSAEHTRRIKDYEHRKIGNIPEKMLQNMDSPVCNLEVLSIAMPEDSEQFFGSWIGRNYDFGGKKVYTFTAPLQTSTSLGDYSEVPIKLNVDGPAGWYGVQFFLNTWTNDYVGLDNLPGRWFDRSFVQLKHDGRVIWEQDVSMYHGGGEWVTVPLPVRKEGLKEITLSLRVENRAESYGYGAAVFVGPMRVLVAPR